MRVFTKIGATMREHGIIYNSVKQILLMYGSKSWVVLGDMLKVLEGFHHQAARWITGMTAKYVVDGEWEYSSVVAAL